MENMNVPIDDVAENVVEETFSFTLLQEEEDQESDFEFGCVTPDSPTTDSNKNSPADLLFFNGRLQPHVFPAFHHQSSKDGMMTSSSTTSRSSTNCSTPTSRTTSISTSKESYSSYSFTSSRSTSSNSRSSCSSTSTSTLTSSTSSPINVAAITKTTVVEGLESIKKLDRVQPCHTPIERPRWYFIRPAPLLMSSVPEVARRKKTDSKSKKKQIKKKRRRSRVRSWFGWRYFRSIVWACKACAMRLNLHQHTKKGNCLKIWKGFCSYGGMQ